MLNTKKKKPKSIVTQRLILKKWVTRMDSIYRKVMYLTIIEGRSYEEVINIKRDNFQKRLHEIIGTGYLEHF